MATAALSDFKSALQYGGARPALFDLTVYIPGQFGGGTRMAGVNGLLNTTFQCNVSAIPPLTVTPIEKQYFGRTVKIPGDIVYGDLSTTFLNTEDYSIRNAIEVWMDKINSHSDNLGFSNNTDWVAEVDLNQYDKEGEILMNYVFIDCWPTTLAEIPLSYDTASDIEQFDVTWAYNYYETFSSSSKVSNGNQS